MNLEHEVAKNTGSCSQCGGSMNKGADVYRNKGNSCKGTVAGRVQSTNMTIGEKAS